MGNRNRCSIGPSYFAATHAAEAVKIHSCINTEMYERARQRFCRSHHCLNHLRHAIHLCFRVVEVRTEAEQRLAGAVVAQGRGDALLVEVLGDVFE